MDKIQVIMLRPISIFLLLIFVGSGEILAQNMLFDSDEVISIKIEAPFSQILADRSDDAPDHPALISYKEGKEKIEIEGEVEIRGNYRRRADICPFPPLKIKVKKGERKGTIFEAQKKTKLVSHCQGKEYLFREYMVYKFYQLLTPYSYKVRLVKMQYRDTEKQMPPTNAYAFLIESDAALKKRLAGEVLADTLKIPAEEMHYDQMTLLHMFQFMIGNLDWGVTEQKNMTLVKLEESGDIMPVPYDFDFAACVQAPYTGLEKGFNRRFFRNICRTQEELDTLFDFLRGKRGEMESLFTNFSLIPKASREEALAYLNEFFTIVSDKAKVEELFFNSCLNR